METVKNSLSSSITMEGICINWGGSLFPEDSFMPAGYSPAKVIISFATS